MKGANIKIRGKNFPVYSYRNYIFQRFQHVKSLREVQLQAYVLFLRKIPIFSPFSLILLTFFLVFPTRAVASLFVWLLCILADDQEQWLHPGDLLSLMECPVFWLCNKPGWQMPHWFQKHLCHQWLGLQCLEVQKTS